MSFKDFYKIMGLEKTASQDEIKRAYKKLARRYHPDVSKEADAEDKFKELGEAYEVLKDEKKRKQYDAYGEHWKEGGAQGFHGHATNDHPFSSGGNVDLNDLFGSLFGQKKQSEYRPVYDEGRDVHAKLSIRLEESFSGVEKTIQLQTENNKLKTVKVKIPKGIGDKQQIRLKGQGSRSNSGKTGDLFIEINIESHDWFRLQGKDIYLQLPISPWEAVLGAKVQVPTLSGMINLKIPKLSQSGKRMRLKGKGLPGNPEGSQYVTLQIVVPVKETNEENALFQALKDASDFNPREALGVNND